LLDFAREQVAQHANGNEGLPSDNAFCHSAAIIGAHLVLTDAHQEMQLETVHVPLMFADIVSGPTAAPLAGTVMWNILTVGVRGKLTHDKHRKAGIECYDSVWILMISTDVALRKVLTSMGSVGAIRSDFHRTYSVAEEIGCGSASTVYRATCKTPIAGTSSCDDGYVASESLAPTAVKIFSTEKVQRDMCDSVSQEFKFLLAAQQHPNIVVFYGLFKYAQDDAQSRWAMSLEVCGGGDLHERISNKGVLSEELGAAFAFGISSALSHLHKREIVHRDVKTENILISDCNRPVLTDFGIAAYVHDDQEMDRRCGSPGYAAPEVLAGERYGAKVDIFGMGVILYFCLSGKMPFDGSDICTVLRRTLKCRVNFGIEQFAQTSEKMKTIVTALLQKRPDVRPSSLAAVQHIQELYASTLHDDFLPKPHVLQTPRTHEPFRRSSVKQVQGAGGASEVAINAGRSSFVFQDEGERLQEKEHRFDDMLNFEPPEATGNPIPTHNLSRVRPLQRKSVVLAQHQSENE